MTAFFVLIRIGLVWTSLIDFNYIKTLSAGNPLGGFSVRSRFRLQSGKTLGSNRWERSATKTLAVNVLKRLQKHVDFT